MLRVKPTSEAAISRAFIAPLLDETVWLMGRVGGGGGCEGSGSRCKTRGGTHLERVCLYGGGANIGGNENLCEWHGPSNPRTRVVVTTCPLQFPLHETLRRSLERHLLRTTS